MKKNKLLSFFTMASIAIFFSVACKKDKKADDPNISYRQLNKTIVASTNYSIFDSIDLNQDGHQDYYIQHIKNAAGDSVYCLIMSNNAGVYVDTTNAYSSYYVIKSLDTDVSPIKYNYAAHLWWATAFIGYRMNSTVNGIGGQGNKYLPVAMVKNDSTLNYGWLQINLSSDFKTLKIIDGAYSTLDNTPIKMSAE